MIKCRWCWVCDDFVEAGALPVHHQLQHPGISFKPPRVLSHASPVVSQFHDPKHPNRPHEPTCAGWHGPEWESD